MDIYREIGEGLIAAIAREAVYLHTQRPVLERLGHRGDFERACRRLVDIIEATYPSMVADWVQARESRGRRGREDGTPPPVSADGDLPF